MRRLLPGLLAAIGLLIGLAAPAMAADVTLNFSIVKVVDSKNITI